MRIRNISNQTIIARRTDHKGDVIDTLQIGPGDSDVHEIWKDTLATKHAALVQIAPDGAYEGPTIKRHVEPTKDVEKPAEPAKDDKAKKADEKGPGQVRRDG